MQWPICPLEGARGPNTRQLPHCYYTSLIGANDQVAMNWAYISSLLALSWFNVHQIMSKLGKNQVAIIKSCNITARLVNDKPVNNFMTGGLREINDSLSSGALLNLQRQSYMRSVLVSNLISLINILQHKIFLDL